MTKESVALGVAGVLFGFLTGWIIGAQQTRPASAPPPAAASAAAPGPSTGGASAGPGGQGGAPAEAPKVDQARIDGLRKRAADNPRDAAVRAEIGNAYFDAERYPEAITWYEASLGLDAKNVDVSTDLGVSYYYANQADRALAQFERSLQIAPESAEGRAAKRMIEAVRSAHPEAGGPAGGAPGAKPQENGAS